MNYSELLNITNVRGNPQFDFFIEGLAYDSRKVKENYIFFALKGLKDDGSKYIKSAIDAGAKAIVTDMDLDVNEIPTNVLSVKDARKTMALFANVYNELPSEKLKLIGVTGTNGKTTTTYLIKTFLENSGYKTGLLGTIDYQIGDVKVESKLTTPESVEICSMLGEMVKQGYQYCVMEVSSIALVMKRVYSLNFNTAIFTNLTSEHLDFHHNMENYFEAKKILFDDLSDNSFAITNLDDIYGEKILADTKAKKITYAVNADADYKAENSNFDLKGLSFDIKGKDIKIDSNITGKFNIYNMLASIACVRNYNISYDSINDSLKNFEGVNGRFNKIELPNGAYAVVDYSHTSDSLKNAIESAREIVNNENKNGRVITIFGCGGNKDVTKRPVMGKFATELSDYSIMTSDNPRFEKPLDIIREIRKGAVNKNYEIDENRETAIEKGIRMSKAGDIILICGKGHETYQEINGVRTHFDDKEMVQKYSHLAK
ncbi:MAG: UDP-N-acetylmuramoyl-L-alanyl-D-glutamate--2,6-diaminopimelate ligase [Ignavibacteria bacterium]|nr:UDP-N-acetylmuramoyl-L-alanyl-D-glutamate--2,6-diaminopimelate ligase [Ignavibacteria bacterium]